MEYDFDTLADRLNSGNMKHMDTPDQVLEAGGVSYCGAEMDFKTAPAIVEALVAKARNGLYGYTLADDEYLSAIVGWMRSRRGLEAEKDWIVPTYGTLQSIAAAIRAFTAEGEGIVIQPPVYLLYERVIERNGRRVAANPLICEQGRYRMDYEGLEILFAREDTKLMILCNPHNPIGKIWGRDDLAKVAELAEKHGVIVISDEIFAEVAFGGRTTVSYLDVPGGANHGIAATSLGKSFNFTGFSHANMLIASPELREKFRKQRNSDHYGSMNPFVREALIAAYSDGGGWLDAMLLYVEANIKLVGDFLERHLPQVTVSEAQGTFLVWIDWNALGMDEDGLHRFLRDEAGLDLDRGSVFGEGGYGFTRMNLATPRGLLEAALERLRKAAGRRGYTTTLKGVHGR